MDNYIDFCFTLEILHIITSVWGFLYVVKNTDSGARSHGLMSWDRHKIILSPTPASVSLSMDGDGAGFCPTQVARGLGAMATKTCLEQHD